MITRDYFLRMIHQLAEVLSRVLRLKTEERFPEALQEIGQSSRQLLGMDLSLLTRLSDQEHIRLLGLGDRFDLERCVAAAELLRMTAEVRAAEGEAAASFSCATTSLSLYLELLSQETGTLPPEYFGTVSNLIRSVSGYELPLRLRQKLFRYYEYRGMFDLAENLLFDVLEEEPGFAAEGLKFYERLQAKRDDELQQGNLPRAEIEDGIRTLRGRLKRN